jgi:hypothetical protein
MAVKHQLPDGLIGGLDVGRNLEAGNIAEATHLAKAYGLLDCIKAFRSIDFEGDKLPLKLDAKMRCAVKLELALLHLQHTGEHYWAVHCFYQFSENLAEALQISRKTGENFYKRMQQLKPAHPESLVLKVIHQLYSNRELANLRNHSFLSHGRSIPERSKVHQVLGKPHAVDGPLAKLSRILHYEVQGFSILNAYLDQQW